MVMLRFSALLLLSAVLLGPTPVHAQGYPLHVGGNAADVANAVHYDAAGNSYVAGAFRGTANKLHRHERPGARPKQR